MSGLTAAVTATVLATTCAFAAVAVAGYGGSSHMPQAAAVFAAMGLLVGCVCAGMDVAWRRMPAHALAAGRRRAARAAAGHGDS